MSRFWVNTDTGTRWKVLLEDPRMGDVVEINTSSDARRDELCALATEQGTRVLGYKKLYPFNIKKNYDALRNVHDMCVVVLTEMQEGVRPNNAEALEYITKCMENSERFMDLPMPLAWVDGKTHRKLKEYAEKDVEKEVSEIMGVAV